MNGGLQGQSQNGTLACSGEVGQRRTRSSLCGRRTYQPGPLRASGRPAVRLHARVPGVCVHKLPNCGARLFCFPHICLQLAQAASRTASGQRPAGRAPTCGCPTRQHPPRTSRSACSAWRPCCAPRWPLPALHRTLPTGLERLQMAAQTAAPLLTSLNRLRQSLPAPSQACPMHLRQSTVAARISLLPCLLLVLARSSLQRVRQRLRRWKMRQPA